MLTGVIGNLRKSTNLGIQLASTPSAGGATTRNSGSVHVYYVESILFIKGNRDNVSFKLYIIVYTLSLIHRMIHAFSDAGILNQQYLTLSHLARIGVVGKRYIYQGKGGTHLFLI